jgi:hypothetical protein
VLRLASCSGTPHSYTEWNILGQYDVPGFFYLESRFRLNPSAGLDI